MRTVDLLRQYRRDYLKYLRTKGTSPTASEPARSYFKPEEQRFVDQLRAQVDAEWAKEQADQRARDQQRQLTK